jgi:hypothetical protein
MPVRTKDKRKITGKGMDGEEDTREKVESWTKSVVVCDLPAGPIRAACAAAERIGEKWPGREVEFGLAVELEAFQTNRWLPTILTSRSTVHARELQEARASVSSICGLKIPMVRFPRARCRVDSHNPTRRRVGTSPSRRGKPTTNKNRGRERQ